MNLKSIVVSLLAGLVLNAGSCASSRRNTINSITLEEALKKAETGEYGYVVVLSSGSIDVDTVRQNAGLRIYSLDTVLNKEAILFLNGYSSAGNVNSTFERNDFLSGRRHLFPSEEHIEIADAENTPRNAQRIAERKNPGLRRILCVTSNNSVRRTEEVLDIYFPDGRDTISVLGVKSPSDTPQNWVYENIVSRPVSACLLYNLKGKSANQITEGYNTRRYNRLLQSIRNRVRSR